MRVPKHGLCRLPQNGLRIAGVRLKLLQNQGLLQIADAIAVYPSSRDTDISSDIHDMTVRR